MSGALAVGLVAVTLPQAAQADPAPTSGATAGGTVVSSVVPAGATFVGLGSGSTLGFGLTSDGTVYSWGYNAFGQLGDGTTDNRPTPGLVDTSGLPATALPLVKVTAGNNNASYALGADGTVYSWGWNGYGQLGDGTTVDRLTPGPVDTSGLPASALPFKDVTANDQSGYALGADGNIYAWGGNDFGQLGDGTDVPSLVPVTVVGAPAGALPFRAVAAGGGTAFGLGADGTIYAWGGNNAGALGDGTWITSRPTPEAVLTSGLPASALPFVQVTAGGNSGYGLGADGTVYAWGYNSTGQLGDGTITSRPTPEAVLTSGLPASALPFVKVAAGASAAYGLGTDGVVYSWGGNAYGQLGDGNTTNFGPDAVAVDTSGLPSGALPFLDVNASAVGVSGYALGSDGNIYSWGMNYSGQLGDGTITNRWSPVPVWGRAVTVLGVTFGGVAGTGLSQQGGIWTVTAPAGCGPVDVVVSYRQDFDTPPPPLPPPPPPPPPIAPAPLPTSVERTETYPDGFVYGSPPAITRSTSQIVGGALTTTIEVSGDDTPTVQWQTSSDATTWADLPGQTSTTLTVPNATAGTSYRAVVANCWSTLDVTTYTALSDVVVTALDDPSTPGSPADDASPPAGPLAATGPAGVRGALTAAVVLLVTGAVLLVLRRRAHLITTRP